MKFQIYKQYLIFINFIRSFFILFSLYTVIMIYSSAALLSLHKNNYKKKLSFHQLALSEEASSGSNPWSNAFNFKSVWGTQTDPRTGILSVHVKTGSLLSNFGHGPNIGLEVNYSSNANSNIDGLGTGWSWNLTHFNPSTNSLATSMGQSFYLQQKSNCQWYPLYYKRHDIHIGGTKAKYFIITYANGLRETLDHQGYETMLEQQNGWRVHFTYLPGTHRLQSVSDDTGHKIALLYQKDYIKLISKGSAGQLISVLLNVKNGELRKLILPLQQDHTGYGIDFSYAGHLLTKVSYPTGLTEIFTYNCTDAMKVNITKNFLTSSLCVITRKRSDPGAGQPVMQKTYKYSKTNSNEHDYLGFNAQLIATADTKKDILFEAPANYTYQTQEDNGILREIHTYNKYHLLINNKTISDHTGHLLSEIQIFFCRTNQSNGCAHSAFEKLPPTYNKPLKIITKLWNENSDIPAVTTETYNYDKQGKIIFYKDTYGRLNKVTYCSPRGDADCPAEPDGWNLGSLIKSVTAYPASIGSTLLKPVVIHNYYRKLSNQNDNGFILVLDHQIMQSGKQKITIIRRYYQDTNNSLTYGLLKQDKLTDNMQRPFGLHEIIHDYYYQKSADNLSKISYSVTELGADKQRFSPLVTTSMLTDHILQQVDASGKNLIRYHYDLWDRPVQTDINIGTPFAAKTHYQYTVSPQRNQLIITAANGLRSKTIFDGAGRPLIRFREALSDAGKVIANHWIPVSKTTYDNDGRVATQSVYIISSSGKTETLTTKQEYDNSDRVIRVYQPDGEININQYDDARRCVVSYRQSAGGSYSAITVTHANILYKPVEQWLFPGKNDTLPAPEKLCSLHKNKNTSEDVKISTMTYDGFGRIVTATDPLGHIVKKEYDALGRLININDPKGDKIHNVYDLSGHVIQHWVQPASGGNYLLASAEYNAAGELLWHAGEDSLPTKFTYTKEGRLATTTTPDGYIMAFQYNVIGLPVSEYLDGKIYKKTSYDPATSLVATQTDHTGKTLFTYSDDGLPLHLQHIGIDNYLNYKLQWKYDQNRRIVSVSDINANQTQTVYDRLGRVTETCYHPDHGKTERLSTLNYDNFSRIIAIDYGSGMQRKIAYDSFGHQKNIRDKLNGKLLSAWSFTYDANDNITTKIYQVTNNQQATFSYKYDVLNNLATMTCSGSFGLPLCPKETDFSKTSLQEAPVITRQDYYFTPLNRIAQTNELLQSSSQHQSLKKIIRYHYTNASVPMRLKNISTIWNNHPVSIHNFSYDIVGNMAIDGEGNHIIYNAFNQITQVTKPDGEKNYYDYDGSGREIYEKSRSDIRYLFYQGRYLINERISTPQETTHTISYQGVAKAIDGVIRQYNESNYKGDVVSVLTKGLMNNRYQLTQRSVYSPYGMRWNINKNLPFAYKQPLTGFNGERTDPATGWQFLGAGHRTYNPQQRYFVSEDPVGGGYGFASNNPIMNSDPDGNMPQWLGSTFKWFNYISTFGLGALHGKWARFEGVIISCVMTVGTLGMAAYAFGGILLGVAVAAGAALADSVPVVAAAVPANQGLDIAASVIGITETVSMIATVAADIGLGLFTLKRMSSPEGILLQALSGNRFREAFNTAKANVFDVANFIKRELPGFMVTINNKPHLNIADFDELCTLWNCLRSNSNLIRCDSAGIFVFSYLIKRPLNLEKFQSFLQSKFIMRLIPGDYTYSEQQQIADTYWEQKQLIFKQLYNKKPFYKTFKAGEVTSLEALALNIDEIAYITIPYHSQLIVKEDNNSFLSYYAIGNRMLYRRGTSNDIERIFFSTLSNSDYHYIMSFMKFKI